MEWPEYLYFYQFESFKLKGVLYVYDGLVEDELTKVPIFYLLYRYRGRRDQGTYILPVI